MSEWRRTTIGEVITLQRGFDITRANQREGRVPVISSGGIGSYHDTAAASPPGVIMGRKGTLGKIFYVDEPYWPHDTTLWVKDFKGNNARFVYYFLKTLDFLYLDVGSANPTLNRNHVHPIEVLWPNRSVQDGVASLLGALDDKIAANERTARISSDLALAHGAALLDTDGGTDVHLGEVANVTKGLSYRSADLGHGRDCLVGLKCVGRDGTFQPSGVKQYGGAFKPAQQLHHGDVLVAQTDLTQRAEVIGRPVRVVTTSNEDAVMVASLDLVIVRPARSLSREVLHAILATPDFREHALAHCNGTTVLHMGSHALPTYRFRLPEVQAIENTTAIMAPLFERSDQALREGQALRRLRDTLLPALVSGELRIKDADQLVSSTV